MKKTTERISNQSIEKTVTNFFYHTIIKIIMGLLILLSLTLFFQVLMRYVFRISVPQLLISLRFSTAWIVFLGSAIAIKEGKHLQVDILSDILPKRFIKIRDLIVNIIVLLVLFTLIPIGVYAWQNGFARTELITRRISYGYYYSSLLVGLVFMIYFQLIRLKNDLFSWNKEEGKL